MSSSSVSSSSPLSPSRLPAAGPGGSQYNLRSRSRDREQKSETDAPFSRSQSSPIIQSLSHPITRNQLRINPSLSASLMQPTNNSDRRRRSPRSASVPSLNMPSHIDSSSSSSSSSLPFEHIISERKMEEKYNNDTHISTAASVSVSSVSPSSPSLSMTTFHPLPPVWKQIPARARLSFIYLVRRVLAQYTVASSQGDRTKCNALIQHFLDIPRIHLLRHTNQRRHRSDPVNNLIHQINHRHNDIIIQHAENEEKRIIDRDAQIVQRAVWLVKMGDMKRAIQTLSSNTPIASINDDTVNKLIQLHPSQPPSDSLPPHPPSDAPKIIVCRKKLATIIRRRLNNGAAGGPSGWTGKLFQPLATDRDCMEGLAAIIQDICNGEISDPILRDRLLACRLIPLQKPNGGIRPIAIGETLGKLASCYALSLCMKSPASYRKLFPTIQEGVGIAGGCENVIHFIRTARSTMGNDSIVITVDFKNAYNMRKRIDMFNSMLQHRSESNGSRVDLSPLIRFYHWSYSVPSPLVLPQSNNDYSSPLTVIPSAEGVRQGANESSLLFSLSMQPLYEAALAGMDVRKVQAKAIQDDFTIVGKPAEALEVFNKLIKIAGDHGMTVQQNKCCVLPPQQMSDAATSAINELQLAGVTVSDDLLHLLGAVIAKHDDIDRVSDLTIEWADNVCITQNEKFFELLTHRNMPAQIAFRLLLSSGLPRLNYLCRVLSPAALTHATHAFDQLILKTLYKILNIKADKHRHRRSLEKFSQQIQLKMKNGGLGLTRYSDIAPAAFLSSLSNATPLILTLYEEMGEGSDAVRLTEEKYDKLLKIIIRRLHDICDESALHSLLPSTIPISDLSSTRIPGAVCHDTHPSPLLYENSSKADFIRHLQSKLASAIEKKKLQRYQSSIDRSSKARLLSASQPSASTWLTIIPEENDLSLNDSQFCAAIRHRLAIPTQSKCCQCEPEAGIINDSIHSHSCKLLKKEEINQRHEYIVYTLRQLCDLANQHSSIHHRLNYDNIDKNIRPDLYVYINGTAYMIDVSIVCPAVSSHVQNHNAHEIPLSSAIHRGKEKVRKYHRLARQNHMKFVPFILESFGAIDKQARSFISLVAEQTNDPHQFSAYCMRRLSIALQRGNSDIQTRGMKRLLLDQSFSVNDCHQQVPNILFYNDASSSDSDRDCSSSEDSDWDIDGEEDGDINDDDQRNDWDWIGRMEEGRMGNE